MGIDAGFDMVPRLSKDPTDKQNWQSFIRIIKERYGDDEKVKIQSNYIFFEVGEGPTLPFEGHKFLRFSSKVSGSCGDAQDYLDTVARIAKYYFGSRIESWSEAWDTFGFYDWNEVHDSFKSHEQNDDIEDTTRIAESVFGQGRVSGMRVFEEREIPKKGRGLIARFNLAKGERIICEKPLFTTQNITPISVMESCIAIQLEELSKTKQRIFRKHHNNFPGKYPLSGIVKTNALPCGEDSCLPNSHNNWNVDTDSETIHAINDIKAGDEITISYDKGGTANTRQKHLLKGFGFQCSCALCSLPLPLLKKSDARRIEIPQLDDKIGDPSRVIQSPADCLADCRHLLEVLQEEYPNSTTSMTARLYYDAFQISIVHGDQARASIFAERAYKGRLLCEGEDSPNTKRMKNFMENPKVHQSFGAYSKPKGGKVLVPKNSDADEFEKWLWRG